MNNYFEALGKNSANVAASSEEKRNKNSCCGFSGLFGHVLEVFLPNVSPVSVASIFRGQESELCLCFVSVSWIVEYL